MSDRTYKSKDSFGNLDWNDVENKVSIICRKFNNIDSRFKEDLAQELRLHAYYVSDDYYDLQRKAIDFWRVLTRRVYPEIPYIDLELTVGAGNFNDGDLSYEETLRNIKKELSDTCNKTSSEIRTNSLALRILDVIVEDIDGSTITKETYESDKKIPLHKYRNGKINLSYLDLRFPDYNYKSISKALGKIREVVELLMDQDKI